MIESWDLNILMRRREGEDRGNDRRDDDRINIARAIIRREKDKKEIYEIL